MKDVILVGRKGGLGPYSESRFYNKKGLSKLRARIHLRVGILEGDVRHGNKYLSKY